MAVQLFLYWGPRKVDPERLVPPMKEHFQALAETHEGLSRWAALGKSLKQAMAGEPIDISDAVLLRQLLMRGQNKTDMRPRQPIPELGYSFGLWNQRRCGMEASASVHCGSHSEYLSENSQNNVLLEVSFIAEQRIHRAALLALFRKLIAIWNPEWGHLSRNFYRHAEGDHQQVQYVFYQRDRHGTDKRQVGHKQEMPENGALWLNPAAEAIFEV